MTLQKVSLTKKQNLFVVDNIIVVLIKSVKCLVSALANDKIFCLFQLSAMAESRARPGINSTAK